MLCSTPALGHVADVVCDVHHTRIYDWYCQTVLLLAQSGGVGQRKTGKTLLNYTPSHQDQLYTPDYVRAVVESAGSTMMMMPATGTRPGGYVSCMPDIADDEWFAYAANDARVRYRATLEQHNE